MPLNHRLKKLLKVIPKICVIVERLSNIFSYESLMISQSQQITCSMFIHCVFERKQDPQKCQDFNEKQNLFRLEYIFNIVALSCSSSLFLVLALHQQALNRAFSQIFALKNESRNFK